MKVNVFNSNNPNGKRVAVTVTIEAPDLVQSNDGEVLYIIGLHTGAVSVGGQKIDPIFINDVTQSNIMRELQVGLTALAAQIDWGILEADIYAPTILELFPINKDQKVPIDSNVSIRVKDMFPASFIDDSSVKLKVNGIDVSSDLLIKNRESEIVIDWIPIKIK